MLAEPRQAENDVVESDVVDKEIKSRGRDTRYEGEPGGMRDRRGGS